MSVSSLPSMAFVEQWIRFGSCLGPTSAVAIVVCCPTIVVAVVCASLSCCCLYFSVVGLYQSVCSFVCKLLQPRLSGWLIPPSSDIYRLQSLFTVLCLHYQPVMISVINPPWLQTLLVIC